MKKGSIDDGKRRSISYEVHSEGKVTIRNSIFSPTLRSLGLIDIYNNEGQNVTPFTLSPLLYERAHERPLFIYEPDPLQAEAPAQLSKSKVTDSYSAHSDQFSANIGTVNLFSRGESLLAMPEREGSGFEFQDVDASALKQERLPDMTHVSLNLVETETIIILDITTSTFRKDTPEGVAAEADNRVYEYLTQGKGCNRKKVSAEVQTVPRLSKSRETDAPAPRKRHNHSFASDWDMYDTYCADEDEDLMEKDYIKSLELVENITSTHTIDSYEMSKEEKEMLQLVATDKFYFKLCLMERMLASNNFHKLQKRFRGLDDPSPFRENIEYNYTLTLLWTFANHKTEGKCVTAFCRHPINTDILAISYGKFFYADNIPGMVMIWNIKNPVQPERTYDFEESVTAVHFSVQNCNLLAIGFYDGSVVVIDISSRRVNIIARSRDTYPSYEPIWKMVWYIDHDYFKGTEFLLTSCQDGRISRFRLVNNEFLDYTHMMRVAVAEGKVKGLQKIKECAVPGISITRYPAALILRHHPADPNVYYVGTGDGVVHKCSKNYYHQHLDLFVAHDGPMYEIKFSPFCDRMFLTCGDDWTVRIWCEGIGEHLFELKKSMQSVQGADWSPSHSTVLASITGADIFIWDLQRKTYAPQSEMRSPTKARNTIVRFTMDGRCLLVGDVMGNMHVFALDDMPFPAMFQANLLSQSVNRGLVTRPDLKAQIKNLGGLSFDKKLFQKYYA